MIQKVLNERFTSSDLHNNFYNRRSGISFKTKVGTLYLACGWSKILSISFFADTSQAIVWRGPMASKAVVQMFSDADWGELDYMIIDLPPGTCEIHLSLVGAVPLTG